MASLISSHQGKSSLIQRTWRNQVNRVSVATDSQDVERYVSAEHWQQISPYWDRECAKRAWAPTSSRQGVNIVLEFDNTEPYAMLSGLFEAIACPIGLSSKIVSQKQKDQMICSLIEAWFADRLYETNRLTRKYDQLGQRWIEALPSLPNKDNHQRPAFVNPALVPWLAERIHERTFINRGEGSATQYFRWFAHEGRNGLFIFAAYFMMGDERAYAIGPVMSTRPLNFGAIRKPPKIEEQQALDFLLRICGADTDAVRFESPMREITIPSALRAIMYAARSPSSLIPFELPATGSLFAA